MNDVFRAIDDQILHRLGCIDYDVGDLVYCEIEDKVNFNTKFIIDDSEINKNIFPWRDTWQKLW